MTVYVPHVAVAYPPPAPGVIVEQPSTVVQLEEMTGSTSWAFETIGVLLGLDDIPFRYYSRPLPNGWWVDLAHDWHIASCWLLAPGQQMPTARTIVEASPDSLIDLRKAITARRRVEYLVARPVDRHQ